MAERPQVVVIGGGFGGLTAARALARVPVDVTLVDRKNHHVFQPLLYQVATAGLSPAEIAAPIRHILRRQRATRVLLGEVTATAEAMHAEVVCTAKRDLSPGERLDGIGGTDWHGTITTHPEARARRAVPIGIGAGAVVRRAVARGATITEEDVTIDESTFVCRLRRLQDALYA